MLNFTELDNMVKARATVTLVSTESVPASLRGVNVRLMGSHFYASVQRVTIGFLNEDGTYAGQKMSAPLEWIA